MDKAVQAMKTSLQAFRLYVPEILVKQLISTGEKIEIGGKEHEWNTALKMLKVHKNTYPEDYVCKLYIERCEEHLKNEPSSSWNGTTKLDVK